MTWWNNVPISPLRRMDGTGHVGLAHIFQELVIHRRTKEEEAS